MSSQRDFTEIQRRLLVIFERGHRMDQEQLNRAIDGITGQALQMVRRRRQEMPPPVPRPVAAAPLPWDFHLRPHSPPSPPTRQLTGPLTAPLRAPEPRRNPLEKTVTIKKAEFDAICVDSCAICLEKHKKGDTVMTDCCHEFGKECFNQWFTSPNSNHKCPTCRKEMPCVTAFKTRVSRTLTGPASAPARRPIVIEEDEEQPLMIF
jgi:hypothetical protein